MAETETENTPAPENAPQAVSPPPAAPGKKARRTRVGRRRGADRTPPRPRSELIDAVEAENLRALPRLFANLRKLADGGYEQVEVKWGTPPRTAGKDRDAAAGPDPTASPPLAPEAGPDLHGNVVVGRKVTYADPDRAANQYLIDRILGRPGRAADAGPAPAPLPDAFLAAIAMTYGPENRDAAPADAPEDLPRS